MVEGYLSTADLDAARTADGVDRHLLGSYLSDHLTGSTGGLSRIQDMARRYEQAPFGADLARVAQEVAREKQTISDIIGALELGRNRVFEMVALVAERLGSLKPNGRLVRASPMTPVLELELMQAAVNGKRAGWETLEMYADDLHLPGEVFATLARQSQEQEATLHRAHLTAARRAFRRNGG